MNALLVLPKDARATGKKIKTATVATEPHLNVPNVSSEDLGSHVARETVDALLPDVNLTEAKGLESQADPARADPKPGTIKVQGVISSRQELKSNALEATPIRKERKQKRKRPKDEIDDLFAGLL